MCKTFKKFFQRIQSYPNESFSGKPVGESCFFHSCLSTCQKSKSDINLLVKYWRLKNTEMSLAWEPDFSQACSFRRMLMNHKNFHFTQISDKTNDVIFLKSPKTMLLGHFWPFLVIFVWWGFYPKNQAVTNNYIWASNTMLSFRKNWWANLEKTYGQMEGQTERPTEGWTDISYFIGSFRPRTGVQ